MKTLEEAKENIGKHVIYSTDGLNIICRVTAVKSAYGIIRYKIKPVKGSGEKWTTKELEVCDG